MYITDTLHYILHRAHVPTIEEFIKYLEILDNARRLVRATNLLKNISNSAYGLCRGNYVRDISGYSPLSVTSATSDLSRVSPKREKKNRKKKKIK